MNRVDCTTPHCGMSEPFTGDHPEGWRYVLAAKPPQNYTGSTKFYVGTCPGCVERWKLQQGALRMPGGTAFKPETWEQAVGPKQKSLFGDD